MYLRSDVMSLRAPELRDLDYLFHVENDTRQWLVSACKVPYSRFQLQQYIETNAHDIYMDKQLRLMIEREKDKYLVGIIDLFDFSP
ncbi:MAG: GNAT family N-acetyltransferase, partial [Bacteroidaceae bacterium]|nr:GNAT family N-acetyltransferase [Bacteroidaceae bacterium]